MKRRLKIGIFVLALVAFWSMTAPAAEINIASTYTVNVTVFRVDPTTGAILQTLTPVESYGESVADGSARYPAEVTSDFKSEDNLPLTTSASAPGTNWIIQNDASMTWAADGQNYNSSHQVVGWAPNSSAPGAQDGFIEQVVSNWGFLDFDIPADGLYQGIATRTFTNSVSLEQAAGSANTFQQFEGFSYFYGEFDYFIDFTSDYHEPYFISENSSTPLSDFNHSFSGELPVLTFEAFLSAGDLVSFYAENGSDYFGSTNTPAAPLPSTLLFLGSGLAGLLVLNRRRLS